MARIRSLKPEIWLSAQVMNLSHSGRLLFIGLITQADDEGRGSADVRRIKAAIFGGDDVTTEHVRRWLDELVEQELAVVYFDDKHGYLYSLPSWSTHQNIDRKRDSSYPKANDSTIVRRMIDEPSSRPRRGWKDGGKEGASGRKEGGIGALSLEDGKKTEPEPAPESGPTIVPIDNELSGVYFDKIKAIYPKNSHRSDWINTHAAILRLVSSGRAEWETLLQAVERYRAFCDQGGVGGDQFVLAATRFFADPSEPWAEKWIPPKRRPSSAESRTQSTVDAIAEARAELFPKKAGKA